MMPTKIATTRQRGSRASESGSVHRYGPRGACVWARVLARLFAAKAISAMRDCRKSFKRKGAEAEPRPPISRRRLQRVTYGPTPLILSCQLFSIACTVTVGQRHIVEAFGQLVAVVIGPFEEFQRFGGVSRIRRLLVDEDEGRARDRPRVIARPGRSGPRRSPANAPSRRWRPRPGRRLPSVRTATPVLVDHAHIGQVVLLGIGIFDIADGAVGLGDVAGNTFIALRADAGRPFHGRRGTHLGAPSRDSSWRDNS